MTVHYGNSEEQAGICQGETDMIFCYQFWQTLAERKEGQDADSAVQTGLSVNLRGTSRIWRAEREGAVLWGAGGCVLRVWKGWESLTGDSKRGTSDSFFLIWPFACETGSLINRDLDLPIRWALVKIAVLLSCRYRFWLWNGLLSLVRLLPADQGQWEDSWSWTEWSISVILRCSWVVALEMAAVHSWKNLCNKLIMQGRNNKTRTVIMRGARRGSYQWRGRGRMFCDPVSWSLEARSLSLLAVSHFPWFISKESTLFLSECANASFRGCEEI